MIGRTELPAGRSRCCAGVSFRFLSEGGQDGVTKTWPGTSSEARPASSGFVASQGGSPSPGLRPTSPRRGEVQHAESLKH